MGGNEDRQIGCYMINITNLNNTEKLVYFLLIFVYVSQAYLSKGSGFSSCGGQNSMSDRSSTAVGS